MKPFIMHLKAHNMQSNKLLLLLKLLATLMYWVQIFSNRFVNLSMLGYTQ